MATCCGRNAGCGRQTSVQQVFQSPLFSWVAEVIAAQTNQRVKMGLSSQHVQAYYDEHTEQKLRDHTHGNARVELAWRTVEEWAPPSPSRILEIGCGVGSVCHRMSQRWRDAEITGLDISRKSIETARRLFKSPRLKFIHGKVAKGMVTGMFELILLMDVYEHIEPDDRQGLHELLQAALSPDGRIILTFPTPRHLAWLQEHHPDQIQPVDEDIGINQIMTMAENTRTALLLYQEVDVWHAGDYAHAVLRKCADWNVTTEHPQLSVRANSRMGAQLDFVSTPPPLGDQLDSSSHSPTNFLSPQLTPQTMDSYIIRTAILDALKGVLPLLHGTLLDVGCGQMPYKPLLLAPPSRVSNYLGLDLENGRYAERGPRPDLTWQGRNIPLDDETVDCAIATELFEHLPEPEIVMSEILRVLRPGGLLFFTVPFLWNLHDVPDDYYRFTPFALEMLLKRAGFHHISLRATGGWDAALAQMIGLWIRRSPRSDAERTVLAERFLPFYRQLIETDNKPDDLSMDTMIIGVSGTAAKPSVRDVQKLHPPISTIPRRDEKRLVIVEEGFPKLSETFILDQITGLMNRGFTIENWAMFNTQERTAHTEVVKYDLLKKTRYLSLPAAQNTMRPDEWVQRFCSMNSLSLSQLQEVKAFQVHFGPAFIALQDLFASLDTRVVVSFHGYDATKYIRERGEACYQFLFARADLITVPSEYMRQALIRHGCPSHKTLVHRYGINLSHFNPAVRKAASSPVVILTVGRLVEKKGIECSLKAIAKVPRNLEIRYRIVGDGPLLPRLRELVSELQIEDRVRFLGRLTREAVVSEMAAADVFVLTSITASDGDTEGLPVGLIEAHAMGLPAVSTFHAGIPELVQHGKTGLLSKEGDEDRIAEYLAELISNAELRARFSRNARMRVQEEFDIEKLNDRLAALLTAPDRVDQGSSHKVLQCCSHPLIQPSASTQQAECPICGGRFLSFESYGVVPRPNAKCPSCHSLERHRLLWLFLKARTNFFKSQLRVLDIAPTEILSEKFRRLPNIDYVSIDLSSPHAMRRMDITALEFPDDEFDCILCSHVLEHVPDDRKAMKQLLRVLRPGGWTIVQVPIDRALERTFDGAHLPPHERERLFEMAEHVRMYGIDFSDRLRDVGFSVTVDAYAQELTEIDQKRHGISPHEDIYFCVKPVSVSEKSRHSIRTKAKEPPFFSILIPSFNRGLFLEEALRSALSQTYTHYEVVLVDDGSTDDTPARVRSYASPRIRYIPKEHTGAPDTRNRCVREATGEFLVWLDSDDVLMPFALARYSDVLKAYPDLDVIYGDLLVTDKDLVPREELAYPDWYGRNAELLAKLFFGNAIPNPGTVVRKECYERIGGYDKSYPRAHDYEWWVRLAPTGRFKHAGARVVKWRWHESNMSSGSVKFDTSYDARIVRSMLQRHGLKVLMPQFDWARSPSVKAEASAWLLAARRLLELGDVRGAKECSERSYSVFCIPSTREIINMLGSSSA